MTNLYWWIFAGLLILPVTWAVLSYVLWWTSLNTERDSDDSGYIIPVSPDSGMKASQFKNLDRKILSEIQDKITLLSQVDARQIDIAVNHGNVRVRGSVNNKKAKEQIDISISI